MFLVEWGRANNAACTRKFDNSLERNSAVSAQTTHFSVFALFPTSSSLLTSSFNISISFCSSSFATSTSRASRENVDDNSLKAISLWSVRVLRGHSAQVSPADGAVGGGIFHNNNDDDEDNAHITPTQKFFFSSFLVAPCCSQGATLQVTLPYHPVVFLWQDLCPTPHP